MRAYWIVKMKCGIQPGWRQNLFQQTFWVLGWVGVLALLSVGTLAADGDGAEGAANSGERDRAIERLAERAREAVVVVWHSGRDGEQEGLGSGFVVAPDGLIATSLHVIGEGRPVTVQLADGRRFDVTEIRAWDRKLDLALIRIPVDGLRSLALGDSDELKQGTQVVAMGNPLGLRHSLVQGIVSARREFDGVEMIQIAIPIEPGNSGGPLLDMEGRVHGILTMKSLMSANLGFAMPVNALKSLIQKPNPIPVSRWVTFGGLDTNRWMVLKGARWSERGGEITVRGRGEGFGGRAFCLWNGTVPEGSYAAEVTVRLDDESGAAGLLFESDGGERHYGFYPSGGQLRLTRFNGPNVFSWTILEQVASPHYRPGEWNRLQVQVDPERIRCYVNGELVIESEDKELRGGKAGLAKFRDTEASFRRFRVDRELPLRPASVAPELAAAVESWVQKPAGVDEEENLVRELRDRAEPGRAILLEKAAELERRAERLRGLADRAHWESVQRQLVDMLQAPEEQVDLFHAALLVSKLDNPDLDVELYRRRLERMADEIRARLPADADNRRKLEFMTEYLFVENGFHGSRTDYYDRSNSYMNDVMDDREGLPITLSVLFLELGNRIELEHLHGAALPGHFMVKYSPEAGPQWVDVFDGGKLLGRDEVNEKIMKSHGMALGPSMLEPAGKRDIIVRMLRNLLRIAQEEGPGTGALRYLDVIVALDPANAMERLDRALTRLRTGDRERALEDLKYILEAEPQEIDLRRVRELYRSLIR